ncbi:3-phytase [Dactylella cylindrospora]|nr:3-phytase [Dactylella cylindrospora]
MRTLSPAISVLFLPFLLGATSATSSKKFEATLFVDGKTSNVESDTAAVYYPTKDKHPVLFVGNDGSAETGGFRLWDLYGSKSAPKELSSFKTGRSKLVEVIYAIGEEGEDYVVTLSMQDGLLRLYEIDSEDSELKYLSGSDKLVRGDFSAICTWRSKQTGNQYVYVMGKRWVYTYLIREKLKSKSRRKGEIEIVETQEFALPVEPNSCAVSPDGKVFFGGVSGKLYSFPAADTTTVPKISEIGEPADGDEINALKIYHGKKDDETYLLVGIEDAIQVYGIKKFNEPLGTIRLDDEDLELNDLAIYQPGSRSHPDGTLIFAGENDDGAFFGTSSLSPLFKSSTKLKANTKYDPRDCIDEDAEPKECPKLSGCNGYGFCPARRKRHNSGQKCECFPGFAGDTCNKISCPDNCTSHLQGTCTGPNTCTCKTPWTGEACATLGVPAHYETEESGGADGDDPAIWIHPTDKTKSKIITTIKSEVGSGLGVFDLTGKRTGGASGGEPNNVDILYGFEFSDRRIDLTVAACRADNTICMYEITPAGDLVEIDGGVQSLPDQVYQLEEDFEVYGSCVYHSPKTGAYHIFVNSKTSLYLQFELAVANGKLSTALVRHFYAGNRGQVEGCVVDDPNSVIFIGEEPYGLWSYPAEPDAPATGTLVDNTNVDGGKLHADVEGVTLVYGKQKDQGYIIVSCQGFSEYNVYKRVAPHDYVLSFTIPINDQNGVDRVTNTDGITAVGTSLGDEWPFGMVVVHDDVNEAPDGSAKADATFKILSLKDILGNKAIEKLGLLDAVDNEWDPRK